MRVCMCVCVFVCVCLREHNYSSNQGDTNASTASTRHCYLNRVRGQYLIMKYVSIIFVLHIAIQVLRTILNTHYCGAYYTHVYGCLKYN